MFKVRDVLKAEFASKTSLSKLNPYPTNVENIVNS
jgi:hypothetical protein